MITNHEVIFKAIQGDPDAVMSVAKEYNGYIANYARRLAAMAGQKHIDEDARSELIIKLIESLKKFDPDGGQSHDYVEEEDRNGP